MPTPQAHINPSMLRWARGRVGIDLHTAAKAAHVKPEQLERWEMGDGLPTFKQAQNVAHALHAPFGFFFLQQPPEAAPLLPDLRTVGGAPVEKPSVNLIETIQHALQRQAWYADYQQEQGAQPLPFVGKFKASASPRTVAADIREVLDVDVEEGQRQWDVYHRDLIQAAEQAGILVMRSGIVGNNTRRKLDVGEFRGFAISHATAPVIFINAADAPAARLFTLLHELAHIWLGSSGISNAAHGNTRTEEVACNAIAGEFLAPADAFQSAWANASPDWPVRLAELARRFHVSQLVVARRALDLGLINRETYNNFYLAELERFRQAESQGGSYYRNAGSKNSTRFAKAVIAEAFSGRLLLRDAGKLLGVQPAKLRAFAEQLGT
jgi:Zn-dependent peptidase ImmA (M78 family)/transcriptional regulator with XRE-family HTH domain